MNPNNLDENIENNKKKNTDLNGLFIQKFVEEVKGSFRKEDRNELIEKIGSGDSITQIMPQLEYFHSNLKQDNKEFENFEVGKLNFFDIKRAFTKDFVKLKNTKSSFISEITRNYELDDKQITKIRKELNRKSTQEIENIAKDVDATEKFLEKEVKIGKPKSFDISELLDGFTEKELQKRLKKVGKYDKQKVEKSLQRLAETHYTADDFRVLFATNFFNDKEKKFFLQKYNTAITLKEALDFKLITPSEAESKKDTIISEIISKDSSLIELDDDKLEILKGEIDLRDIKVDVLELGLDKDKINKFVVENNGLQKLDKEIQDSKKEMEENYEENAPENFIKFKKLLGDKYSNSVENLGNFDNGSYLKIIKTDSKSGKTYNTIYEITSKDNQNRAMSLKLIGDEGTTGIDLNSSAESQTYSYAHIIGMLDSNNETSSVKLEFISKKELLEKLHSKDSSLKSSEYTSYTEADLENPDLKTRYMSELEQEVSELEQEIEKLKKDISKESKEKLKELEDLLYHKKTRLENLQTSNNKVDDLETLNFEKLIRDLDSVDTSGVKFGLKKGLFLEGEKGIAEIYGVDAEKSQIIVKQAGDLIPLSFSSFYDSFKKYNLKRVEKINDFQGFLESLKNNGVNIGDNYKFKNGKFIAENEGNDSKEKKVKFFVSKDGKEIVKINSIDGDKITITLGEREKKKGKETHSMQKKSETLSLNEFKTGIIERNMFPDWKVGVKTKDIEQTENSERHGSFGSRFLNRLSFSDLLASGKMFIDNFEESFKRGSEASSAKLALKMGKLLPDDLRHNLQIKVEGFEAEESDKALKQLGQIDSGDAAKKIKKWLKNRDTPDYKIEAGMLFMLEKYGHLTAKGKDEHSLFDFRGKFMWYEALGGRVGDELYNEIEEEAKSGGNVFCEERLVYILISKQCKEPGGYKGKKRRSRLYKEVEGKMGAGIEAEIKKGHEDASKKNFAVDMIEGGLGELLGGTTANSIGWFKKVVEKGGTIEEMSKGFFVLLYSGALYEVDGSVLNHIKNLFEADKQPMVFAEMCKNPETMSLARNVILQLSKRLGEEYPELAKKNIVGRAEKIFNNATSFSENSKQNIKETISFFDDFGKPISRAMNMVNSDDTTYSRTDKIIFFEKDENPVFGTYYNTIKGLTGQMSPFGKDFMEDACGEVGLTGLDLKSVTKEWLKVNTSRGFVEPTIAEKLWKEIGDDIVSTKDKIFQSGGNSVSTPENKILQKKYLKHTFRQLLSGIKSQGGLLEIYNNTGSISDSFKAWGIAPVEESLGNLSPESIESGGADDIIDNAISVILGEKGAFSGNSKGAVDILKEEVIETVNDDILKN